MTTTGGSPLDAGGLVVGETYSPEQLSQHFGFKPYYLRTAGGMVPVPARGALLLVTHAQRGASFEYGDYWSGEHLIYTGRGQSGDQKLETANLDVAENRRTLYCFEHVGKYQRLFLGLATCVDYWWTTGPDKTGAERQVLQFRLGFEEVVPDPSSARSRRATATTRDALYERRPRPFDETVSPTPRTPAKGRPDPSETSQQFEKAAAEHHRLLVELKGWLLGEGWSQIEEIPAAVDLWARKGAVRVIFEAKTIATAEELQVTRMALSQLLEYRFFYGKPEDELCIVANKPLSARRLRFLNALKVGVIYHDGVTFRSCGELRLPV